MALAKQAFTQATRDAITELATGANATATNDNATAGCLGEFTSTLVATGAAVSLTTATAANVATLSLSAGDWDVTGAVNFNAGSATQTALAAGISATTATLPTDGTECANGTQTTTTTAIHGIAIPRKRISIASTTSVFLVAKATFSAGTEAGWGQITARRVR